MINVYDKIFDQKFLVELDEVVKRIPLIANNTSERTTWPYGNKGNYNLLGRSLYHRTSEYVVSTDCPVIILEMLEHIVFNVIKTPFFLKEVNLNMQFYGADAAFHVDPGNQIVMMCNSEWEKEWGGPLEYIDSLTDEVERIDYTPGRVIFFDGQIKHRGVGPSIPSVYRYTLNFR